MELQIMKTFPSFRDICHADLPKCCLSAFKAHYTFDPEDLRPWHTVLESSSCHCAAIVSDQRAVRCGRLVLDDDMCRDIADHAKALFACRLGPEMHSKGIILLLGAMEQTFSISDYQERALAAYKSTRTVQDREWALESAVIGAFYEGTRGRLSDEKRGAHAFEFLSALREAAGRLSFGDTLSVKAGLAL